jgi:hypothetical protein
MPGTEYPVLCPQCRKVTGQLLPPSPKKDGDTLYFCTDCQTVWKDTVAGPVILTGTP